MNRFYAVAVAAALSFPFFGCGDEEEPFVPATLHLEADGSFQVGESVQLTVVAKDEKGEVGPFEERITFSSSDERVATVDEDGLLTLIAGGPVTITAAGGGLEATLEQEATCTYPEPSNGLGYGTTLPPMIWSARTPEGEPFLFKLDEVHCSADWKHLQTIHFVISAGWCGPCTAYAQTIQHQAAKLKQLGMQIVIVEVDTLVPGTPADSDFAYSHVAGITNVVPGFTIGDLDGAPTSQFFRTSKSVHRLGEEYEGYILNFPTTFVVRTDTMEVIADDSYGQWAGRFRLPLEKIAQNPAADWSTPQPWMFE